MNAALSVTMKNTGILRIPLLLGASACYLLVNAFAILKKMRERGGLTHDPYLGILDAGKCSGWCHLSVHEDGEIGIFNQGQSDHLQIGNMLYDNSALKAAAHKPEIETLFAAETFTMSPGKTQQPYSLETIGLIRYFAAYYQIPLYMVSPSAHKPLIKDDVIKRLGIWVPGQPHAMDSVRVAIYTLIKERGLLKWSLLKSTTTESG